MHTTAFFPACAAFLLAVLFAEPGHGQLYYDTNGNSAGTAATSTQNLTDAVWTTDPTGLSATGAYVANSSLIFSAGADGTGTQSVTVTGTQSVAGLTIDNGALTLFGASTPSLTIGSGGITMDSPDGAATLDTTLGTVTLGANQQWNDDSTQTLQVNSSVNGGGHTLTFDGTGSGSVVLSALSNINLLQESATSKLYLTANDSVASTTISNDGTISAVAANSVGGTITFNNGGGTLDYTNAITFGNKVVETAPSSGTDYGATFNFTANTVLAGGTNNYTASLLTFGSGDVLDETTSTQSISTLDLAGGGTTPNTGYRTIVGFSGQGFGLIHGATINVENGYTLDFGSAGTIANLINVQSGSAVENRANGTLVFTDTQLPTSGSVTLGADDVGEGTMDFTADPIALTGDLTIHLQTASQTLVKLGNISGNANLNITGAEQISNPNNASILYLTGTDTYSGATTLEHYASPQGATKDYAPFVDITGNSSGVGTAFNIQYGTLAVNGTGSIPAGAIIDLGLAGNTTNGSFFMVGDGTSAGNVTVAGIYSLSTTQSDDYIVGGNAAVSNLTVDVAGGGTDIYYGKIGGSGSQDNFTNGSYNNVSITVGGGTLVLVRGDSAYTGGSFVNGSGSILEVASNGVIGSGAVTLTNSGELFVGTSMDVYSNTSPTTNVTLANNIVEGAGGGDLSGEGDYSLTGTVTGGTSLTVTGGDALFEGSTADSAGTVNVNAGRLLAFTNAIFGNNAVFNAAAILDFGFGGSSSSPTTVTNAITIQSGGALENRSGYIVATNVTLPGAGTVTLGSDDVGGGSLTIEGNTSLTGALAISVNGSNGGTATYLNDAISGTGSLTLGGAGNDRSALYLGGNLTYAGNTTVNNFTVQATGSDSAFSNATIALNTSTLVSTNSGISNSVINLATSTGNFTGAAFSNLSGTATSSTLDLTGSVTGLTDTLTSSTANLSGGPFSGLDLTMSGSTLNLAGGASGSTLILSSSAINLTGGGTLAGTITANTGTSTFTLTGSSASITAPIELSTSGGSVNFQNNSATGNLTVGSIDFSAISASRAVYVNAATTATGLIELDGTYTSPGSDTSTGGGSTLTFGSNGNGNGNYELGPDANFLGFETNGFYAGDATITLDAGSLYIDTSTFSAGQVFGTGGYAGTYHAFDLVGSQDILAQIYMDEKHGPALTGSFTLAQSTAGYSIWAGAITLDSTQMVVSAVDGGRLDISGAIGGSSPTGLVKTGDGVVVFSSSGGNSYGLTPAPDSLDAGAPPSPVDIDIQQGTLLVETTSGATALGNNSGTVEVEAGATLGGFGVISQQVVAMDPNGTSTLTAGDPGQASLGIKPAIGQLTLQNLSAPNGLTLDFKLTANENGYGGPDPGKDNDAIEIVNFTLGGDGTAKDPSVVTVNISMLGNSLATGVPYILLWGPDVGTTSAWTENPNVTFVFNLPWGYELDSNYMEGVDQNGNTTYGYDFDPQDQDLVIQFIFVPEPSTCALIGVAVLGLIAIHRRRRLTD